MLNFTTFIRTLKKYADNINISEEAFFRNFFEPIIDALEIKSTNGDLYDFSKSRISGLLNQKEDFSNPIREAISHYQSKKKLLEIFPCYIEDNLNYSRLPALIKDLKEIVEEDVTLSKEFKNSINKIDSSELIVSCFIQAIKISNIPTQKQQILWKSGNYNLKYISGDIIKSSFNNKKDTTKIVVIPVNTSFETQLSKNIEIETYPLVSENTIHGQWLKKILKEIKKEDLDKRIQSQLENKQIQSTGRSKGKGGKQTTYPIGTTAIIHYKNTIFYLLAISEFDEKNNAQSSMSEIKQSIIQLLRSYESFGQGYEMLIPLLGTGQSRAQLTPQESFLLIKNTILENNHLVKGQIKIVILENTLGEINNAL